MSLVVTSNLASEVNIEQINTPLNNNTIDLIKENNINKIRKMMMFKDDWNGTGGKAFVRSTILFLEKAIMLWRKWKYLLITLQKK